jgi:hypothetical protein
MAKYIICLLCLALMLAGCGKSAEEKAIEKAVEKSTGAGAEVDLSDKGMKISGKTEEGAFSLSTGEGTEIPKDFPADVLIYNPSKVGTAMNMGAQSMLVYEKGDRIAHITIAPMDDETQITVMVTKQ